MIIRTYNELMLLPTFKERFEYLKLSGRVGEETFGFDRWINQKFYRSAEWKHIRDQVIIRDNGCDLGVEGREIYGKILIHHMNPITKKDILDRTDLLLNPMYLISVTKQTHDAIHYSDESILMNDPIVRSRNDTCPWRHD
uniref:HNH endonuclease bacteriophage, HNH Endonuclease, DNA.52A n=1 Tax=Siphoviridae sp. ctDS752 TaxID=2825386 RepID=A0A8S5U890_9CAUD|nr:MAG TPA: HNH endonuclease bacteriophage, HNH Endonuclease, DNA.52A [Caudoviricetes sp.]DAF90680.1 MAG TPA: HNH endonuclease bacteriophage, HNH Endonuclease, DNA.52A [Siphoviridae sp. ctDS752]